MVSVKDGTFATESINAGHGDRCRTRAFIHPADDSGMFSTWLEAFTTQAIAPQWRIMEVWRHHGDDGSGMSGKDEYRELEGESPADNYRAAFKYLGDYEKRQTAMGFVPAESPDADTLGPFYYRTLARCEGLAFTIKDELVQTDQGAAPEGYSFEEGELEAVARLSAQQHPAQAPRDKMAQMDHFSSLPELNGDPTRLKQLFNQHTQTHIDHRLLHDYRAYAAEILADIREMDRLYNDNAIEFNFVSRFRVYAGLNKTDLASRYVSRGDPSVCCAAPYPTDESLQSAPDENEEKRRQEYGPIQWGPNSIRTKAMKMSELARKMKSPSKQDREILRVNAASFQVLAYAIHIRNLLHTGGFDSTALTQPLDNFRNMCSARGIHEHYKLDDRASHNLSALFHQMVIEENPAPYIAQAQNLPGQVDAMIADNRPASCAIQGRQRGHTLLRERSPDLK